MKATRLLLLTAALLIGSAAQAQSPPRDTMSDTWAATDALGRRLPLGGETPAPRRDRWVGIFTFLWHGEHGREGPFDNTKILAKDPAAMAKPDSPLWGPLYAPHHWGEPNFGYYLSTDEWVHRRHARMLADAGVDVAIFDVTNQLTYPASYRALCRAWERVRREGGRTPQIAFLTPFWDPPRVARALYEDLYRPGDYSDLWFRWENKPLILADPALITPEALRNAPREPSQLAPGTTQAQTFWAERRFTFVGGPFPTYATKNSAVTLTLYGGPDGKQVARKRLTNLSDNAVAGLELEQPLAPGAYRIEQSEPSGSVGWWTLGGDVYDLGNAMRDGSLAIGDRTLVLRYVGDTKDTVYAPEGARLTPEAGEKLARDIRAFFTFRKPQPDYFQGPTGPNQWGWLEVFPQHVFYAATPDVAEQMVVGVAQNALDGKLGVLSNPRANGRSFHNGAEPPPEGQDFTGRNFAEQWERALQVDPRFIFVTGWNEWIAGRFPGPPESPFYGSGPVSFVDQFNHEFSRDIEPVRGGHGDDYYYQFVSYVRRYKGARAPEPAGPAKTIRIDGRFADWNGVMPEYRDDAGDTDHRDHAGWGRGVRYVTATGRNDFIRCKIARDDASIYAYAQTRAALSRRSGEWMNLYLNTDGDGTTGWMGFDIAVNRTPRDDRRTSVEAWRGGRWTSVGEATYQVRGDAIEIGIPRAVLKLRPNAALDFKWTDNTGAGNDPLRLYSDGDAAPNGRFAYCYAPAPSPFPSPADGRGVPGASAASASRGAEVGRVTVPPLPSAGEGKGEGAK